MRDSRQMPPGPSSASCTSTVWPCGCSACTVAGSTLSTLLAGGASRATLTSRASTRARSRVPGRAAVAPTHSVPPATAMQLRP